jgi:hypothetical protein
MHKKTTAEKKKETFNPESLVSLASLTAARHLTYAVARDLPEDIRCLLQGVMSEPQQIKVFRNYKCYDERTGHLREHTQYDEHGKIHGLSILYYADGSLWERSHSKHGLPHGSLQVYSPCGPLLEECLWEDGHKHGLERCHVRDSLRPRPTADGGRVLMCIDTPSDDYYYRQIHLMTVYHRANVGADNGMQRVSVFGCRFPPFDVCVDKSSRDLWQSPWGVEESLRVWKDYVRKEYEPTGVAPDHGVPGSFLFQHCPCQDRENHTFPKKTRG